MWTYLRVDYAMNIEQMASLFKVLHRDSLLGKHLSRVTLQIMSSVFRPSQIPVHNFDFIFSYVTIF